MRIAFFIDKVLKKHVHVFQKTFKRFRKNMYVFFISFVSSFNPSSDSYKPGGWDNPADGG